MQRCTYTPTAHIRDAKRYCCAIFHNTNPTPRPLSDKFAQCGCIPETRMADASRLLATAIPRFRKGIHVFCLSADYQLSRTDLTVLTRQVTDRMCSYICTSTDRLRCDLTFLSGAVCLVIIYLGHQVEDRMRLSIYRRGAHTWYAILPCLPGAKYLLHQPPTPSERMCLCKGIPWRL